MTTRKTTMPLTPEPPNVERRSSWRDEHLDCICGLANGRGGVLDIGREVRREAIGMTDLLRLAEEIPIKVQSVLNIVVNVHVRSHRGRDYLRIVVPSHLDRTLPQRSDHPENSQIIRIIQKTARKPGTVSSPSCERTHRPAAGKSPRHLPTPPKEVFGIRSIN